MKKRSKSKEEEINFVRVGGDLEEKERVRPNSSVGTQLYWLMMKLDIINNDITVKITFFTLIKEPLFSFSPSCCAP